MNAQIAAGEIRKHLRGIAELYNRLLLVVGPTGSGKTAALRAFAAEEGSSTVNVGVELGRSLLDLTERQTVMEVPSLLERIVGEAEGDTVVFDNTEILFNPVLNQDPLRLLKALSRNRTIVASWLGSLDGQHLVYATPEHREFRRYPLGDLMVVDVSGTKGESLGR